MIDLHTHSTASDGSLSPTELVSLAASAGVTCLALTDHNTTAGLPAFLTAASHAGLRGIAGVEITAEWKGQELHILAMDLPRPAFSQLQAELERPLQWAQESKRALTERLTQAGFPISYEALQQAHPASVINRAHIALHLAEQGYAASVHEAFANLLSRSAGFYRPPQRLPAGEVLAMIRDLGAISVWAHPFHHHSAGQVERILEALTPAGLDAMETFYSTYSSGQTRQALALAEAFHLKQSGGSDFHGAPKPDIQIGTGRGNLLIPETVAEQLLRR